MKNITLSATLLLFAILPLRIPAPQVAPYPTCAFYGDSLAAGHHLLAGQTAFPADTVSLFQAETPTGNCASVTLDATSGYTSAVELASLQARGLHGTGAKLLVVEFGSNEFDLGATSLAQTTADISALVAYLTAGTRQVALVCTDVWNSGSNSNGTVAQFDAAVWAGCSGFALHVYDVDISALFGVAAYHGGICCGDVYHPNPSGTEAIAQAIVTALA